MQLLLEVARVRRGGDTKDRLPFVPCELSCARSALNCRPWLPRGMLYCRIVPWRTEQGRQQSLPPIDSMLLLVGLYKLTFIGPRMHAAELDGGRLSGGRCSGGAQ